MSIFPQRRIYTIKFKSLKESVPQELFLEVLLGGLRETLKEETQAFAGLSKSVQAVASYLKNQKRQSKEENIYFNCPENIISE